jgi:acyl-CoA synthetase (AMP-forming)/AMP-acid ligase II/acyl carrier protein
MESSQGVRPADQRGRGAETIRGLIESSAGARAQAAALLADDPGRPPMTYGWLLQCVDGLGAQLRAAGIASRDRVAIVLPNGPEMAVTFLAVASAAVAAPLNPGYRAAEFDFYLSDLNARALVTLDGMTTPAADVAAARGIPILRLRQQPGAEAGAVILDISAARAPSGSRASDLPGPGDTALILHTSGTTSRPKIVPLTQANLCASAHNIAGWLRLGESDRCLNVMPLFHIHGLGAAVLASLAAGACVVCTGGFVATEFWRQIRACRPTWYTAVPTMHQAIIARAEAERIGAASVKLRFVRSASAALPPQTAGELERLFAAPVVEAYGMTEAAHQMCCNPLPPGERRFGSVGLPAGPQVAVMDDRGQLLPMNRQGEIVIRGANVTAGYENNPDANAASFTDGWFRTGDLGRFDTDGYLCIDGRIKEIINRGGEKISPREIDEALLDHPSLAAAVTFAVPDPRLGEEIAAAVILKPGAAATESQLMQFAASKLADFKIPRRIVIVPEIPKGPTGKVQRIGLAKALGITEIAPQPRESQQNKSADAPATPTQAALIEIWREVLKVASVAPGDDFLALGGDSILAAQVIARVRDRLGCDLPMHAFFRAGTPAAMAAIIDDAGDEALLNAIESLSDEEVERLLQGDEETLSAGAGRKAS